MPAAQGAGPFLAGKGRMQERRSQRSIGCIPAATEGSRTYFLNAQTSTEKAVVGPYDRIHNRFEQCCVFSWLTANRIWAAPLDFQSKVWNQKAEAESRGGNAWGTRQTPRTSAQALLLGRPIFKQQHTHGDPLNTWLSWSVLRGRHSRALLRGPSPSRPKRNESHPTVILHKPTRSMTPDGLNIDKK